MFGKQQIVGPQPVNDFVEQGASVSDRYGPIDLQARPGLYQDPSGLYETRFWDGTAWTDWVAQDGTMIHATDAGDPTGQTKSATLPHAGQNRARSSDGAGIPCPVCRCPAAAGSATCPSCGHPLNPKKSGATLVLILGLISLYPGIGIFFGVSAWSLGNQEIRLIEAGLRRQSGRRRANLGRRLGIAGVTFTIFGFFFVVGLLSCSSCWGGYSP
jgi:hypothetical protein